MAQVTYINPNANKPQQTDDQGNKWFGVDRKWWIIGGGLVAVYLIFVANQNSSSSQGVAYVPSTTPTSTTSNNGSISSSPTTQPPSGGVPPTVYGAGGEVFMPATYQDYIMQDTAGGAPSLNTNATGMNWYYVDQTSNTIVPIASGGALQDLGGAGASFYESTSQVGTYGTPFPVSTTPVNITSTPVGNGIQTSTPVL